MFGAETNRLHNWKLPKISKQEVYETSIFNLKKDYFIKTIEGNILLHTEQEPIRLLDPQDIRQHRPKYEYLHVGLVQVGVKALTRDVHNASILLCLRDKRILDFNASLLSVIQSSLAAGPVHVNYYPNIMVSLRDQNIVDVLTLYVKFHNLEIQGSSFPFVLMYKVYYKCMPSPNNPAAKNSSPIDQTTYYQTMVRSPSHVISRTIRWFHVQFPEEWKLRDEIPLEMPEYESPQRIELPDQESETRFPPRNSSESSQFHYGLNTINP